MRTVAALFVETNGCYFNATAVEPWDKTKDARYYAGPYPVVAHPPCQRWGRYWHGSPRKPHQYKLGTDEGCFQSALASVRLFGGIIEHPADSHAWRWFNLNKPPRSGGWILADEHGGWTCCVEQGHYGHVARKATWLYTVGCELPLLVWGSSGQRLSPIALERHGYEKARRTGVMAYLGGKDKSLLRAATPIPFRDLLLSIARTGLKRRLDHPPHHPLFPGDDLQ